MPDDIEQLKSTINSLNKALNNENQYARMEDVAEIVASIKSALNFLKEKDSDLESVLDKQSQQLEVITKLLNEKSNFQDEMRNGLADNSLKHETLSKDIFNILNSIEPDITRNLTREGGDFDTLKKRANDFESNISKVGAQSKQIETTLNVIKKEFSDTLKAMRKELDTLKESIVTTRTNGGVRRVFQPHVERFTHQTNGSRKVFYLARAPLKTDTIKVWGTDFPIILDPTVDFTVEDKTLTLSDAIQAPSSGATLIIEYFA